MFFVMEISGFSSFADMGKDDRLFFEQWPVDSFHELSEFASAFSEDFDESYRFQAQPAVLDFKWATPELSQVGENWPLKQHKTAAWNSCEPKNLPDSHQLFESNFLNVPPVEMVMPYKETRCSSPPETIVSQSSFGNTNYNAINPCQGNKIMARNNIRLSQAQDHILAERKRRQKLNQKFIALSALLPGLKKMDKASILGDAIEYVKQLQDTVRTLDGQTQKTTTMESVVFVKKYHDLYDESFSGSGPIVTESVPVIEARFCNKDVLISIHCAIRKGVFEKIVAEIERFHLAVVNSSVMTYGGSALNITVIAEKVGDFTMSVEELANNLCEVVKMFM